MGNLNEELFRDPLSMVQEFLESASKENNIEIEARLGKICDSATRERVSLHAGHPIIFGQKNKNFFFKPGVTKDEWEKLKGVFVECVSRKVNDKVKNYSNNYRRIEWIEDDCIYRKCEKKMKNGCISLYFPGLKYDIRVSISTEKEICPKKKIGIANNINDYKNPDSNTDSSNTESLFPNKKCKIDNYDSVEMVRNRERESFLIGEFSYDFTKITKTKEGNKNNDDIYEVELEIVDNKNYDKNEFISKVIDLILRL